MSRPPRKLHQVLPLPVLDTDDAPLGHDVAQEIGFLIELMDLRPGEAILDVASGAGRHALELARRGYAKVSALDLSDQLLDIGARTSKELGLELRFLKGDPRSMKLRGEFDAALILGGGAFGLMDDDGENQEILNSAFDVLKPGGRIAVSAMSLLYLVRHSKDLSGFDPRTGYLTTTESVQVEGGIVEELPLHERYYVYPGIKRQLEDAGFRNVMGFGAASGRYSSRAVSLDDPEMLVYAVKPKD